MSVKVKTDYIEENMYSRPGYSLLDPIYIYVHWVANPKTTATTNRDFFDSRKHGSKGFGGAHYIVDDTEVVQCIPETEMAPNVGTGNGITNWAVRHDLDGKHKGYSVSNFFGIAVELCHEDWEGSFSEGTWNNAVHVIAELCERHGIDPYSNVVTHNMVVGWKNCPKWFVDHPAEFMRFKDDISVKIGVRYGS